MFTNQAITDYITKHYAYLLRWNTAKTEWEEMFWNKWQAAEVHRVYHYIQLTVSDFIRASMTLNTPVPDDMTVDQFYDPVTDLLQSSLAYQEEVTNVPA